MFKKLKEILTRPLFGTRVIPKDAVVDPALFPEEEFPVYCPKCDYLLRGLPDGPCPECGTRFARGQLLVRQYVHGWGHKSLKRTPLGKLAKWTTIVCIAAPMVIWALIMGFALLCIKGFSPTTRPSVFDEVDVFRHACLVIGVALVLVYVTGFVLNCVVLRRGARKRHAVLAALKEGRGADNASGG